MVSEGCPHWKVTWFYESSCQIRRTDSFLCKYLWQLRLFSTICLHSFPTGNLRLNMCFISGGNCCTSSEIAGRTLNVNQSYCTPWCTLIQSFVNALLRLSSEMDRKSEMKWMPFSNSWVSLPKIAQHCCPFSIPRYWAIAWTRAPRRLFFLLYKSEKPEVTISNKKPLELPSHYRKWKRMNLKMRRV